MSVFGVYLDDPSIDVSTSGFQCSRHVRGAPFVPVLEEPELPFETQVPTAEPPTAASHYAPERKRRAALRRQRQTSQGL